MANPQDAQNAAPPVDWAAEAAKYGGSVATQQPAATPAAPATPSGAPAIDWAAEAAKYGGSVAQPAQQPAPQRQYVGGAPAGVQLNHYPAYGNRTYTAGSPEEQAFLLKFPNAKATAVPVDRPGTVTQVRYSAPGYGVQEFTHGSTEEQRFLQQHPQAKLLPGSAQRVLQPEEKVESETPAAQTAIQNQEASDSFKDFKSRLMEPVKQSEIERMPGLQPDVVQTMREQGNDALGALFGKQRADFLREHILNGSIIVNVPPEEFARAATKTLTDWYSPAMLALSVPGRIAHGYAAAANAAMGVGDVMKAADLAGKARLVGILGTITGVPFVAKQVHSLADNWDGMTPAERTAALMGILGGTMMTGVSAHETGITPGQIKQTATDAVQTLGNMIPGRGVKTPAESMQAAADAYYQAVNPGKKAAKDDFRGTLDKTMPQLSVIANNNPDVNNLPDMAKAIQGHIDGIEGQLKQKGLELRGQPQAVLTGIEGTVQKALDQGWLDAQRKYSEDEIQAANESVMKMLGLEMSKEKDPDTGEVVYTLNRIAPTPDLYGAENIRQRFSDDTQGTFGRGEVPPATAYAKQIATRAIREAIDKKFTELGVKGVKEWRQQERDLITVKDAMLAATSRALDEKGNPKEWSALNELAKMKGWGVLPIAFGYVHPVAGAIALGGVLGRSYLKNAQENPNVLARKAQARLEAAGPSPEAVVPTFTRGPANVPKTGTPEGAVNPTRGAAATRPSPVSQILNELETK